MSRKWIVLPMVLMIVSLAGCQSLPEISISTSTSIETLKAQTQKVLLESLKSDDPVLRLHAIESIAEIPNTELAAKVRPFLSDPTPAVRFAAAIACGDMKDRASRKLLEELLYDENTSVKLAAGYALEKLGDQRFANWYDKVLFGGDPKLASQACLLLGKLGNSSLRQDSKDKLWQAMRKRDQATLVQLQAAEALARLKDQSVLKKLIFFANSLYADDRILAINGMEFLGGPDVFAMLTVLAEDPQIEVRLSAIRALGKLADQSQIELVYQALKYQSPERDPIATMRVKNLAILALGYINGDKNAGLLSSTLKSSSEKSYTKIMAARAAIEYAKRNEFTVIN